MKKGIITAAAFLLAGAAGAGLYYQFIYKSGLSGQKVSSDSEDAIYVDSVAMLAGLGSGSGVIQRYAGVIEPQETWNVKLENEKTVDKTYVKEGDQVKEGQKLFKYSTSDDEDKVEKDQIDVERDQNNIEASKANITQYQKQLNSAKADDKLTLQTRILEEENRIKQNEYDIKTKQLEIRQCQENIKNAVITSKLTGVVKKISSQSASSDTSGNDNFMTIMAVGEYRVKGTVNEQNISNLTEGQNMIAYSRVDSSQTWKGTITEIKQDSGTSGSRDGSGDGSGSDNGTSSTNYPFYVKLSSSDGLILGQHVYLEADYGQLDKKDGIWLDDYYITVEENGSAWVWAASSKNTLEKRSVALGEYDEEQAKYQILSGLSAEDYITPPTGDDSLQEGLPVIYMDSSADASSQEDVYGEDEMYGGSYFDGGSYYDASYDSLGYDETATEDWSEDYGYETEMNVDLSLDSAYDAWEEGGTQDNADSDSFADEGDFSDDGPEDAD